MIQNLGSVYSSFESHFGNPLDRYGPRFSMLLPWDMCVLVLSRSICLRLEPVEDSMDAILALLSCFSSILPKDCRCGFLPLQSCMTTACSANTRSRVYFGVIDYHEVWKNSIDSSCVHWVEPWVELWCCSLARSEYYKIATDDDCILSNHTSIVNFCWNPFPRQMWYNVPR